MRKISIGLHLKFIINIVILFNISASVFPAQDLIESGTITKTLQKCFELKNNDIESVASDNENLVYSDINGNISQLNIKTQENVWTTTLGNKLESTVYIMNKKYIVISRNTTDSNNFSLDIRELDQNSGITKWITNFDFRSTSKILYVKNKDYLILVSDNLQIISVNLQNGKVLWKKVSPELLQSVEITELHILLLTVNNNLLFINNTDGSVVRSVYVNIKDITAFNNNQNTLFVGNKYGEFFDVNIQNNSSHRVLRTGGTISFIQIFGSFVLITSNDNFVYIYSTEDKKLIWKRRLSGRVIVKPLEYESLAVINTIGESVLLFYSLNDGKIINRIYLGEDQSVKDISITNFNLNVLTNRGVFGFNTGCSK